MARVRISWQAGGRGVQDWGMVLDKSAGGLGIRIPSAIEVGSVIAVAQGFTTSFGVVRHCTKEKGKFLIGIEFCELEEGTKPAPSWKHLAPPSRPTPEEKPIAPPKPLEPVEPKTPEDDVSLVRNSTRKDFAMLEPPAKLR